MGNVQALPFFFFNDTATTEIYTLSLHDALPISKEHIHVIINEMKKGTYGVNGEWKK